MQFIVCAIYCEKSNLHLLWTVKYDTIVKITVQNCLHAYKYVMIAAAVGDVRFIFWGRRHILLCI